MKKVLLAFALGELALISLVSLTGEIKARIKYNKGFRDGANCAIIIKDLEDILKEK